MVVIGQKYGRLTVLSKDLIRSKNPTRKVYYAVRCDCGTLKSVEGWSMSSGKVVSCNCKKKEHNLIHGLRKVGSRDRTYQTWDNMIQRCTNPNRVEYQYYGDRGIAVCDRWLTFANFLADMGERPEGLEIDRVDNDGNYTPGNCRWVKHNVQALNNSRTHRVMYKGENIPLCVLSRRLGINEDNARRQHKRGWTIEQIIAKGELKCR